MAPDRADLSPSPTATSTAASRLSVSAAGLQRYVEAVFRVTADGRIESANPVATEFSALLSPDDLARLSTAAVKSQAVNRALVDLVDVGVGEERQNLQVTLVPLDDGQGTLLFVRDLTLDTSLRLALVDSRRRYKDFIDISSDFAWETGPDQRFAFVPPRGALGYSADGLMALEPAELVAAELAASGEIPFLARRRIDSEEVWLRRSDGRSACVVVSALPLLTKDGQWIGTRGVCRDVSTTRERESTLARVRNRERVLTRIVRAFRDEVNPEAMLNVAAEALSKGLGAEFCHIFRKAPDESEAGAAVGRTPGFQLVAHYGELDTALAAPILATIADGAGAAELLHDDLQVLAAPARYQSAANGAVVLWRPVERGAWNDDDRLLIGDIANQVGITIEQFIHHEHVLKISRTDALTGVLNRGAFIDALRRLMPRLKRENGNGVLMYVDLDNFKSINDIRGHQAGDDMLVRVRDILLEHTRPTDVVARLGGDEFAVWLNGADLETARKRATMFLQHIATLAHLSGRPDRPIGMSIGIAVWDHLRDEGLEALTARADAAMYEVKRAGKGSFTVAGFPSASGNVAPQGPAT